MKKEKGGENKIRDKKDKRKEVRHEVRKRGENKIRERVKRVREERQKKGGQVKVCSVENSKKKTWEKGKYVG